MRSREGFDPFPQVLSYATLGFKSASLARRPTPLGRFLTADQRKQLKKNPKVSVSITKLSFTWENKMPYLDLILDSEFGAKFYHFFQFFALKIEIKNPV